MSKRDESNPNLSSIPVRSLLIRRSIGEQSWLTSPGTPTEILVKVGAAAEPLEDTFETVQTELGLTITRPGAGAAMSRQ